MADGTVRALIRVSSQPWHTEPDAGPNGISRPPRQAASRPARRSLQRAHRTRITSISNSEITDMAAPANAASTDAAFQSALAACTAQGIGGELKFVDQFFSFLRRNTKLLQAPQAVEQVQQIALKHVELAKKAAKEAAVKAKAEAAAKAAADKAAAATAAAAAASSSSDSSASSSAAPVTELKDEPEAPDAEDQLPSESNGSRISCIGVGLHRRAARSSLLCSRCAHRRSLHCIASPCSTCCSSLFFSPSAAPVNNGGRTDRYVWTQTLGEVTVSIPLPAGVTAKMLNVVIEPNELRAELRGAPNTVFLAGEPDERVDSANATWTIETDGKGQRMLDLYVPKHNKMSWWKCVVKGDPQINTKKIVPENSKLDDLDGDTRSTVEKMMFDQRQKQMGKPSSDEMTKQNALKRFMDMHPEMDFSNVSANSTRVRRQHTSDGLACSAAHEGCACFVCYLAVPPSLQAKVRASATHTSTVRLAYPQRCRIVAHCLCTRLIILLLFLLASRRSRNDLLSARTLPARRIKSRCALAFHIVLS